MRPETRSHLSDARAAAIEILQIAGPTGASYLTSRRDALAIERLFEIVGEALNRIRAEEPQVLEAISDSAAIIGMRNVIAHGYDAIHPTRVVATIEHRVPILITEINNLIGVLE